MTFTATERNETVLQQILVNALPARTWNRLNVNESRLSADGTAPAEVTAEAPETLKVSRAALKDDIQSAMGAEYVQALDGAQTLSIEAESHETRPAVIHVRLKDGENAGLRLFLHAGSNAMLRVILAVSSDENARGRLFIRTAVYADQGSKIALYTANLLGNQVTYADDVSARTEEKAFFLLDRLDLGGNNVHTACCTELVGRKSRFASGVAYRVAEKGLLDMNWLARHFGPKTDSRIQVNGVLEEASSKCFRGTIDFVRGCAGATGGETEAVLLMGESQINQTVPLILCEEEDVDGSHGASIGRLDDKMLFYMASRGISEDKAKKLMADSRLTQMRDVFPDENVRREIDRFMGREEEA